MTIALKAEALDYGPFLRNRLLRIFPLFLFVFWIAIAVGRDQFSAADVFVSGSTRPVCQRSEVNGSRLSYRY